MHLILRHYRFLGLALVCAGYFLYASAVLAEPPPAGTPVPVMSQSGFMMQTFLYIFLGFLCFHLLITRPAHQRSQERKNFLAKLKKNDEVMTTGGILGRVQAIGSDFVTVEVASGVKLRVHPEYLTEAGKPPQKEEASPAAASKKA
jgi:preprotein translocase subunit YajC